MIDLPTWVRLGADLLCRAGADSPPPDLLPPNVLLLFDRFRAAYQAKDAGRLGEQLSDGFAGPFYGQADKAGLVAFFGRAFAATPRLAHPKLTVTMYHVAHAGPDAFRAVVEFHSRLAVLGVPVATQDTGRVVCEARPDGPLGIWRLTRIEPAPAG